MDHRISCFIAAFAALLFVEACDGHHGGTPAEPTYVTRSELMTFDDAKAWCEAQGGVLPEIDSTATLQAIYDACDMGTPAGSYGCWTGVWIAKPDVSGNLVESAYVIDGSGKLFPARTAPEGSFPAYHAYAVCAIPQ